MMKFGVFNIIVFLVLSKSMFSQNIYSGTTLESNSNNLLADVEIYDYYSGFISKSNQKGEFKFSSEKTSLKLVFYLPNYNYKLVEIESNNSYKVFLDPLSINLNEVTIFGREDLFKNTKLQDVEGVAIFAGKKTNKILLENMLGDMAANNARHVYNKIGGLNIFQNDDAGLQLNIGGRGLNPGRSANFNIRQNNYDISADVLGYPESYYTPPAEALKEIQVVRGAASLQYGTQFGGLVNFVFKDPEDSKKLKVNFRNTIGSNLLYTNFTSLSGTVNNVSYFSFLNYKKGDGFRPNSNFESINFFLNTTLSLTNKIKTSFELTYLTYLAKQPGGLTDEMFYENLFQSNRARNWFKIDWLLYNLKLNYKINKKENLNINVFALDANRFSLGYRNSQVYLADPLGERDLIKGYFNNYGLETRYLSRYNISSKKGVLLTGFKFYRSNNISQQGPGTEFDDANFSFSDQHPNYPNQSHYKYPNLNIAYFLENILYLNNKLSITPGLRYEYINTKSNGYYKNTRLALSGVFISDTTIYTSNNNIRDFMLFGLGISYKIKKRYELYSNLSQNYRSVTFADITITSPTFVIDPNISDESGYSYDLGVRGIISDLLSFDINYFGLSYNNRIGLSLKDVTLNNLPVIKTQKGNIGDAFIYGTEILTELKVKNIFSQVNIEAFVNYAFTKSEYLQSESKSIIGNLVEFVPLHNLKTGLSMSYKKVTSGVQLTYLSEQFTDATNSYESDNSGVLGKIPAYEIIDFTSSYYFKNIKLSFGINNILNKYYFTRRATGYPGPGIIPSQNRNYYLTLEMNF